MDQATLPTLFDLLARQWRRTAGIGAVAFNADRSAVAFAGTDGSVALVAVADAEPAEQRTRIGAETGRATIRPRQKQVRPAVEIGPVDDRTPALAPCRRASFAVAGADGQILAITPRGQVEPFATRLGRRATSLDRHEVSERTACAAGRTVAILADDAAAEPRRLQHELELSTVAFSPDGARLAAAHEQGVTVWDLGDGSRRELAFAGGPTAVSWSPDGAWLACPLADEGFHLIRSAGGEGGAVLGYPTPTRSVAWSRAADALVTSGAFRAAAWSMAHPPLQDATEGALQTGRPGLVVVERVAAHPSRDLIAVGYANGQVSVMQLGRRDELLLRQDSGGAVTALAWSDDGRHLAFGTADGLAALVGFPSHLFK